MRFFAISSKFETAFFSKTSKCWRGDYRQSLPLNPQGAVIFQDDGVTFVHSHEPVASVNRQHREPHTEIRRQDPVPTETFDFVVVGAGVEEAVHKVKDVLIMGTIYKSIHYLYD